MYLSRKTPDVHGFNSQFNPVARSLYREFPKHSGSVIHMAKTSRHGCTSSLQEQWIPELPWAAASPQRQFWTRVWVSGYQSTQLCSYLWLSDGQCFLPSPLLGPQRLWHFWISWAPPLQGDFSSLMKKIFLLQLSSEALEHHLRTKNTKFPGTGCFGTYFRLSTNGFRHSKY